MIWSVYNEDPDQTVAQYVASVVRMHIHNMRAFLSGCTSYILCVLLLNAQFSREK